MDLSIDVTLSSVQDRHHSFREVQIPQEPAQLVEARKTRLGLLRGQKAAFPQTSVTATMAEEDATMYEEHFSPTPKH